MNYIKKVPTKKQFKALEEGRKFAYTKEAIEKRVKTRKKKNNYKQTLISKKKISDTLKRKLKSGELIPSFKKGQSQQNTGRTYFKKGEHISLKTEFKKGQKAWNKDIKFLQITGKKHPKWIENRSFLIYPDKFNNELKTKIRKRDKFTCQICGKNGFVVHHIDYNKLNCNENNLTTLCKKCHSKTNFDRNYWIKFFNGKIAIVSGHRGLICSFLKKRLKKEGYKIIYSIDKCSGFNILNLKKLNLEKPVNIFFHFAAQCRINEAISKPILPHRNNVDGIFSVLEFCRKHNIPKIVYASTSRVLSLERNPYVASKIYGEEMCKAYHDCYGMNYIIIRPSTVYGPMYDKTSRLINNWLVSAFKGDDLRFYGNNTKTLDFTYIDDFIDGIILSINNEWNKEYNISGKKEVRLLDLADMIIKEVGNKVKVDFLPTEIAQPQRVRVDISKIEKIGFKPKVDIKEGVRKMVEFYRQNPDAWKNYVDKGREYYK